ncbi:hypothetical protein QQ045_006002 [Rhodiola kirilowii]
MRGNKVSCSLVLTLIAACSLLRVCAEPKTVVRLINQSKGKLIMMEHCYSSEDDTGLHYIQPGQTFDISFHDNLFCSTKFICEVFFPNGFAKRFLAYSCNRDAFECGYLCEWAVTENSVCRIGKGKPMCL